jgi:hypothetical protein
MFVQVVKSVSQKYTPTPQILLLLEEFRQMLNDCIGIGLAENVTSKQSLSKKLTINSPSTKFQHTITYQP